MQWPAVFMGLASVTLVLALAALWQSLRSAFGAVPLVGSSALRSQSALEEEKKTLLRAIKDLGFEHELGKISDGDFSRLDSAYRQRAKEVLRLLDSDLKPYLDEAERMIATSEEPSAKPGGKKKKKAKEQEAAAPTDQVPCRGCGALVAKDAASCSACQVRLAPQSCPSCQTMNDPDARFCKSCAAALAPEPPERGTPPTARRVEKAELLLGRATHAFEELADSKLSVAAPVSLGQLPEAFKAALAIGKDPVFRGMRCCEDAMALFPKPTGDSVDVWIRAFELKARLAERLSRFVREGIPDARRMVAERDPVVAEATQKMYLELATGFETGAIGQYALAARIAIAQGQRAHPAARAARTRLVAFPDAQLSMAIDELRRKEPTSPPISAYAPGEFANSDPEQEANT